MPRKRKRPETFEIGDMVYWRSGDDLGECERRFCGEDGFSYNEDGELLCKEHLIDWHEEQDEMADGEYEYL